MPKWYIIHNMNAPLAFRMRPTSLAEVLGQTHLVGPSGFLTNAVNKRTLVSVILFGPPGCGKTTIAEAFARSLDIHFIKINAVTASKKELEAAMDEAKMFHPAIMIVDEVHRLPKDKQDLLLASIEDGSLYLFGATTENPYMVINPAMRSRCHLLEVKPLAVPDVIKGLNKAMQDPTSNPNSLKISTAALLALAKRSGGDLRFAYNALEILLIAVADRDITIQDIEDTLKVPPSIIDQDGGGHYDAVSAMQKSIRGSDVDAALYYLARLIVACDMESIRRRLLITAYEDVGLANPGAVMRAVQAIDVAKLVGFPEAAIPLGFSVCELALSPKAKTGANSIHRAIESVKDKPLDMLEYLKFTPVNMKEADKYPYDRPDLWERIQYLPDAAKNEKYYEINDSGAYLKQLNENYRRLQQIARGADLAKLKKG